MRKSLLRFCSMLLVTVMLFHLLPAKNYAAELTADQEVTAPSVQEPVKKTDSLVVEEIEEDRTAYSKTFRMNNGLYMAVVYPESVHYQKDGGWAEIDNTLKATAGAFTNTAGVWNVSLPQQLSGTNAVSVTKDGHTLRFRMAGELRSSGELSTAAMGTASETLAVQSAQTVSGQVQAIDLQAAKAAAEFPEAVPEKLQSRLQYADVYTGTDIIYDLSSNQLKESIVIDAYSQTLRGYRYTLETGDMTPVLTDSGAIELYSPDSKTPVLLLPAPYMVDSAGEYSYDVTVQLTGSNGTFTLTYLLPTTWLASADRQWPVILDPVVSANVDVTNIQDVSVYEFSPPMDYQGGVLDWGHSPNFGIMRSFVKYDVLPILTSSDVVVGATFRLCKPSTSDFAMTLQLHKVNTTWASSTMTWSNQPAHDPIIEDFANVLNAGYYNFDVTDIVRGWYEGENTGLMFRATDEVESVNSTTSYRRQFYSSDYSIHQYDEKPTLYITFRNNNGLESYWDYTSASAGRAGTGYINNYTGNLVWTRSDIGFGGNRMPVAISHIYNANDSIINEFGLGMGWRTNFNQTVRWSTSHSLYFWDDADGTDHYFIPQSDGSYKDEDGLDLTMTTVGTGDRHYAIMDKYGNTSYFDIAGRLTLQQNNQATPSSISITYTDATGKYISTITDGAGRVYRFTYSGGLLSRISYRGQRYG